MVPPESDDNLHLEIGHVLFIDIVGYSKLLIEEQKERLNQLTSIVLATAQVRESSDEQLVRLPTGDGMVLVFRHSSEEPVRCALEIAEALRKHPELPVRMGIHSGPVSEVTDVSGRTNLAGAGINMAQRVMDCGDAGHILLSQHVADDLMQYRQWAPRLRDLGECEVKHGVRLHLVNLYAEPLGNVAVPQRLQQAAASKLVTEKPARRSNARWIAALTLAVLLAAAASYYFTSHRAATKAAATPEKSIAVLPFENLSSDKENSYFTDGVQDEILTDLAKIADLKVISRTSVMQYKSGVARNLRKIGEELGVAHVVEGSVQRAANKIRVNAQLIDARTDAHLWAQTYDRDLADVFAVQSEIAETIAGQLQAKILPQERKAIEKQPTTDIAAQDLYIRAVKEIDASPESPQPKENLLAAIDLLEEAVRRDSAFLNAFCQQARAHDLLYLFGEDHTAQRLSLAEQAVNAALRLQPNSPEAHLARANHLYSKLDYDGALAELEVVRRTLPNEPRAFELSGYIDRRQGRWEESARSLEHALQLDPNNVFLLDQVATGYQDMRDYPKAAAMQDRILSIRPDDLDMRVSRTQTDIFWKAETRPCHDVIASAIARDPANARRLAGIRVFLAFAERDADSGTQALADSGERTWGPNALQFPRSAGDGLFARLKGDAAGAQANFTRARAIQEKVVEAQPDYGPALCILAVIDAGLGRKEEAISEGRRSLELLPLSKDAINAAHMLRLLAMIYAWVGEKDLAIEQLKSSLQLPCGGSYGELKLFPQWDPLRGDPRFEGIVASLAPKEGK